MILVSTRSSVYELIILPGDQGAVAVRGGRHFPDFRPALLLGSTAADGSFEPRTIDIGLRMKFVFGDTFVVTTRVQSIRRVRREALPHAVPPGDPDVAGQSLSCGTLSTRAR
jgi:hypothetical protein